MEMLSKVGIKNELTTEMGEYILADKVSQMDIVSNIGFSSICLLCAVAAMWI